MTLMATFATYFILVAISLKGQEWELEFDWFGANAESIAASETTLYVGTFGGVYKNVSGSPSWQQITGDIDMGIIRHLVAFDNVVIAAGQAGLWRSSDQGTTWAQPPTVGSLNIRGLDTNSSGHLFCTTLDNSFGGVGIRLYRSTNMGFSWDLVSIIPNSSAASAAHLSIGFNNEIIVAPGSVGGGPHGLYHSTNNGQSWNGIILNFAVSRIIRLNSTYVACSGASGNSDFVYSLNATNWQTGNSGGLGNVRITDAAELGNQIYFSTTGGTFNVNSGSLGISSWNSIGPSGVSFSCITNFDNQLFLGHWGAHTIVLSPNGTWEIFDQGTEGNLAGALGKLGNDVYLSVNSKGFYRKTSSTWSELNSGLFPSNNLGLYSLSKVRESSLSTRVIAHWSVQSQSSYFVLHEDAVEWQQLSYSFPSALQDTFLTFDEPSGFYYLGSSNMGLWRSTDLTSWVEFNSGLNEFNVVDFGRLNSNESIVVTTSGAYSRLNTGNQWTPVFTTNANVEPRRLRIDSEDQYYVVTNAGLYSVVNGNVTFANGNQGLGTFLNHYEVYDASNGYACVQNLGLMKKTQFLPWETVNDFPETDVRRTFYNSNQGNQYVAGRSLYVKSSPNSIINSEEKLSFDDDCLSVRQRELYLCENVDFIVSTLSMYDGLGRLLHEQNIRGGESMYFPALRQGIAIVVLRDDKGIIRVRKKIIL